MIRRMLGFGVGLVSLVSLWAGTAQAQYYYSAPVYAAPPVVYSQPVYAAPTYAVPTYATPVYAAPVYTQPVYAAPYYGGYYSPLAIGLNLGFYGHRH